MNMGAISRKNKAVFRIENTLKSISYFILLVVIFCSCDSRVRTPYEEKFDHIFFKIRLHSIKRHEVNWTVLEKKVKDSIKVFATRKDAERAIILTLELIDDHHSKFIESGVYNPFLMKELTLPEVETKIVGNRIAYIKILGLAANDSISRMYGIKIRDALSVLDKQGDLSGWIIDVRGNNGGMSFIFPLGIYPLLQDSVVMYSKDNRGKMQIDKCINGRFYSGDNMSCSIPDCDPFVNKDKPIAVLMDSITASCGEMTVLMLKNNQSTRSFGSKSHGATSSLHSIEIKNKQESYHAQLLLAVGNWYSKDNKLIQGKLTPDVECLPENSLDSAIRWIEKDAYREVAEQSVKEKTNRKIN